MKNGIQKTTVAGLLCWASVAMAHVTLEQTEAFAGTYYKAVLRVGHGCEGSATRAITVRLPAGVLGAKPMPKPGWTLDIRGQKAALPTDSLGQQATHPAAEISWRANSPADYLDDAHYGEFVLRARLPGTPGLLWFKVLQTCAEGQIDWAQVPASGRSTKDLKTPAALLEVKPGEASAHH